MLRLLGYLLMNGVATSKDYCPSLGDEAIGLPKLASNNCIGSECSKCSDICPTEAISVLDGGPNANLELDLGKCIGCAMCIRICPEKTFSSNASTETAAVNRKSLVLSTKALDIQAVNDIEGARSPFARSVACRVVSTGCSACDLELSAASNSIFDMERFGIQIVASPRFADVLLVTGPVPKAMHAALKSCYDAMAEPKRVVAVGTCAISGGLHGSGYAEANGISDLLPVDVYIPGCPPHPWSIIDGIRKVMR
ncbi:MAG: NADH-quinone oxidoreductase subunit NuoB [Candidatus Melainabacteria bacterium]|nr:NADH-quinone oxidoreductase subunit NuoB [Candidatus Melainabacteria bacterium]